MIARALPCQIGVFLIAACVVCALRSSVSAADRGNDNSSARAAAERLGSHALICLHQGDAAKAMSEAEDALRQDPNYFRGYQARGRVFAQQGQVDRAIADYDRAIQLNPELGALYNSRGIALQNKGNKADALHDFDTAMRVDSQNFEPYSNRGSVYFELNRLEEALSDYNRAIALARGRAAGPYLNRAAVYLKQEQFAKARADIDESIGINARNGSAYILRARTSIAQHDLKRADADIREASKLSGNDPRVLNSIAWLKATCPEDSLRDGKEAVRTARAACELTNWKHAAYIDTLAAACAQTGDFDHAVTYENQALNGLNGERRKRAEARLALFRQNRPYRDVESAHTAK